MNALKHYHGPMGRTHLLDAPPSVSFFSLMASSLAANSARKVPVAASVRLLSWVTTVKVQGEQYYYAVTLLADVEVSWPLLRRAKTRRDQID